jgi:hypothetical protein
MFNYEGQVVTLSVWLPKQTHTNLRIAYCFQLFTRPSAPRSHDERRTIEQEIHTVIRAGTWFEMLVTPKLVSRFSWNVHRCRVGEYAQVRRSIAFQVAYDDFIDASHDLSVPARAARIGHVYEHLLASLGVVEVVSEDPARQLSLAAVLTLAEQNVTTTYKPICLAVVGDDSDSMVNDRPFA